MAAALTILSDPATIRENSSLYIQSIKDIESTFAACMPEAVVLLINMCAEIDDINSHYNVELLLKVVVQGINKTTNSRAESNHLCILLANLTIHESSIDALFSVFPIHEPNAIDPIVRLLELFFAHNPHDELAPADQVWDTLDCHQYISNFICNITSVEIGRKLLLNLKYDFLTKLILQLRSKNDVRRRGIILSVKNILFDSNLHWWLVFETNLVTNMMLLLVVPTPFTDREREGLDMLLWIASQDPNKQYEQDMSSRKALVECVLLLCQTRKIREELRRRKVYPILRNLDYVQEGDEVSEVVLEIVQFLMRDEDPATDPNADAEPARVEGEATAVSALKRPTRSVESAAAGETARVDPLDQVD